MKIILVALVVLALPALAQKRGRDTAPEVGAPLPKVSAVTLADGKKIDLAKPKRHTVLVFGSHT